MRLPSLLLALACLSGAAQAAAPVLKPLSLSTSCQKAGYSALQDAAGTLRVLRYVRLIPDNSARVTQYYGTDGRLQSLKASASGFAGVLYDLTASADRTGRLTGEKGYRSKLFTGPLTSLLLDARAVKAGRCG